MCPIAKPCHDLKPVFNGKYEIIPYNKFGARAVYSCNPDYVLAGSRDRVCQGDGYWSGRAPSCESHGKIAMMTPLCQYHRVYDIYYKSRQIVPFGGKL